MSQGKVAEIGPVRLLLRHRSDLNQSLELNFDTTIHHLQVQIINSIYLSQDSQHNLTSKLQDTTIL